MKGSNMSEKNINKPNSGSDPNFPILGLTKTQIKADGRRGAPAPLIPVPTPNPKPADTPSPGK